nr:immunoglobulin light chain junction region [Macaca mulatta]MPN98306.1 immunoglobulin light chain junction region [Macaca mulatta]
CQQRNLYPLTC